MSPTFPDSAGTDAHAVSVPAVDLRGITKHFGAVAACDAVDLKLHRGRIHGILGENGAGKSTLMNILIGLVLPDAGEIYIDGERVQIHDPLAAASLGIGMVHQHFSLVDALTVWENVALGESGRLDAAAMRTRIGEIGDQYGLAIDPDAIVGDLTAGLRQRVEIIKCLRRDPSIVIFDEPTSVLTPDESTRLFESFREVVAAENRAVVMVSHKLDEVLAATDEITIMRQGRVVDHVTTSAADAPGLARSMVGREVVLRSPGAEPAVSDAATRSMSTPVSDPSSSPILQILQATALGSGGAPLLDEFSLDVHAGEIVGVAGVEGNGQRALGDLLSSLVPLVAGEVVVDGESVAPNQPGAMARAGIGVIPEDRHDSGVVLDMTVAENLVLTAPNRVSQRGIVDTQRLDLLARELIAEFDIGCSGPDAPLWSLSGGNQQRVVLARELSQQPKVLVAAQPTRGLDVGAIEYMSGRLRAAANSGVAVLLLSNELDEILELSDRVAVIFRGRIVGEMPRSEAGLDRLGLLMAGAVA